MDTFQENIMNIAEEPIFFENQGTRLFGIVHRPVEESNGQAFVFCHSFAEEKLWAHRVLVSYARDLAQQGYLVFRFDYRGYGDSEGEFVDCTLQSHIQDVRSAVEYVKQNFTDVDKINLLGHRLGASIVLSGLDELMVNGCLVLWDPVVDGEKYIKEFLRSNLTTQLAVYGEVRETREKLIERMQNGELVNVEGYDLNEAQYDSLCGLNLLEVEADLAEMSVLIVQVSRTDKVKKDIAALLEKTAADICFANEEQFWREIKRFYNRADAMYQVTDNWLENQQ
jgi:exosortase A-associated hydrolase 2